MEKQNKGQYCSSCQNHSSHHTQSSPLVNEFKVAELLCIKVTTLRQWRCAGSGPIYVKIGRTVRYRPEDLELYIQANKKSPLDGSQQGDVL